MLDGETAVRQLGIRHLLLANVLVVQISEERKVGKIIDEIGKVDAFRFGILRVEEMKIVDALRELVPGLVVVLEQTLLAALVDLFQEAVDVLLEELFRLLVQPVGQGLRVRHANRIDICKN